MVPCWREAGIEVDLCGPPFDAATLNSYDLVHHGWQNLLDPFFTDQLLPPITCNVWHITLDRISISRDRLAKYSHFIVDSPSTISMMGQMGFMGNVSYAPMVFDQSPFYPLPSPNKFTVGFLGAEEDVRRWKCVREGAKLAGVDAYVLLYRPTRTVQHIQLIEDFYKHVSVYVCPGFIGTDPLTMHEAIVTGRPVIATRTSGPHDHIKEGVNGYFFDGSPSHLAQRIQLVQQHLPELMGGALATKFPTPAEAAPVYAEMWRQVVEE